MFHSKKYFCDLVMQIYKKNKSMNCSLCNSVGNTFYKSEKHHFFVCPNCAGIFRNPAHYLTLEQEKERYLLHENKHDDAGYLAFCRPIINKIIENQTSDQRGLDFGSGADSPIAYTLQNNQYNTVTYDPFFCNTSEFLETTYDYIVCCEVIEHFNNPAKEFALLKSLLNPQGKLYCMTYIYSSAIDFEKWYYKNDPTHVFIYTEETCKYIANAFGFKKVSIDGRIITFEL